MDRWRCIRCETLNDMGSSKCIVCAFSRMSHAAKTEILPEKCAFADCQSMAAEGQKYCSYHFHTLCPICHQKLKASGLDYCMDCGLALAEKNTSGLRKADAALKVINLTALMACIILLLSYIFYFN